MLLKIFFSRNTDSNAGIMEEFRFQSPIHYGNIKLCRIPNIAAAHQFFAEHRQDSTDAKH